MWLTTVNIHILYAWVNNRNFKISNEFPFYMKIISCKVTTILFFNLFNSIPSTCLINIPILVINEIRKVKNEKYSMNLNSIFSQLSKALRNNLPSISKSQTPWISIGKKNLLNKFETTFPPFLPIHTISSLPRCRKIPPASLRNSATINEDPAYRDKGPRRSKIPPRV